MNIYIVTKYEQTISLQLKCLSLLLTNNENVDESHYYYP